MAPVLSSWGRRLPAPGRHLAAHSQLPGPSFPQNLSAEPLLRGVPSTCVRPGNALGASLGRALNPLPARTQGPRRLNPRGRRPAHALPTAAADLAPPACSAPRCAHTVPLSAASSRPEGRRPGPALPIALGPGLRRARPWMDSALLQARRLSSRTAAPGGCRESAPRITQGVRSPRRSSRHSCLTGSTLLPPAQLRKRQQALTRRRF